MKLETCKKYWKSFSSNYGQKLLKKQQALFFHPKTIQKYNFTGNSERSGNKILLFIIKEVKKSILDFLQGTVKIF